MILRYSFSVLWNSLISTKSIKVKILYYLHDSSLSENSIKKLKIFSKNMALLLTLNLLKPLLKNFLIRDIDHVTNAAYFRLLVSDILPKEVHQFYILIAIL